MNGTNGVYMGIRGVAWDGVWEVTHLSEERRGGEGREVEEPNKAGRQK